MRRFVIVWVLGCVLLIVAGQVAGNAAGISPTIRGMDAVYGVIYILLIAGSVLVWKATDRIVSEKTLLAINLVTVAVLAAGLLTQSFIAIVVIVIFAFGLLVANLNRVIAVALTVVRRRPDRMQRDQSAERSAAFEAVSTSLRQEDDAR